MAIDLKKPYSRKDLIYSPFFKEIPHSDEWIDGAHSGFQMGILYAKELIKKAHGEKFAETILGTEEDGIHFTDVFFDLISPEQDLEAYEELGEEEDEFDLT